MTTARPARSARIIAGLLATVLLVSGCARGAIVSPEQNQGPAQLAKDQAECLAVAKESTDYADLAGQGIGTTLGGSVGGAIVGAGIGALVVLAATTSGSSLNSLDAEKAGLLIAGLVGGGAVAGWFVGTWLGARAATRQAQDRVAQAFEQCMEARGYKVGRER